MVRSKHNTKRHKTQVEDPGLYGYFWNGVFIDDSVDPGLMNKEDNDAYLSGMFNSEVEDDLE